MSIQVLSDDDLCATTTRAAAAAAGGRLRVLATTNLLQVLPSPLVAWPRARGGQSGKRLSGARRSSGKARKSQKPCAPLRGRIMGVPAGRGRSSNFELPAAPHLGGKFEEERRSMGHHSKSLSDARFPVNRLGSRHAPSKALNIVSGHRKEAQPMKCGRRRRPVAQAATGEGAGSTHHQGSVFCHLMGS